MYIFKTRANLIFLILYFIILNFITLIVIEWCPWKYNYTRLVVSQSFLCYECQKIPKASCTLHLKISETKQNSLTIYTVVLKKSKNIKKWILLWILDLSWLLLLCTKRNQLGIQSLQLQYERSSPCRAQSGNTDRPIPPLRRTLLI